MEGIVFKPLIKFNTHAKRPSSKAILETCDTKQSEKIDLNA